MLKLGLFTKRRGKVAKRDLTGITRTRSGIIIVPAHKASDAVNAAIAERNAAQRRANALRQVAQKLTDAKGKK